MPNTLSSQKIVVFDLDETLGSFVEIGIFCDALTSIYGKEVIKKTFFSILDLFPEFLRPNIFKIMKFVKDMKSKKKCHKVMIYTNNQGPRSWAEMIVEYFHKKLNTKLFDQIISAFKVDGKKVELLRTSHNKSHKDLVCCANLPDDTQICFLDDQYHSLMKHDNIYYINIKPYTYTIPFTEMAGKYYDKINPIIDREIFLDLVKQFMNNYEFSVNKKSDNEYNVDKIIGKHMLKHLKHFFKNNSKTKKNVQKTALDKKHKRETKKRKHRKSRKYK